MDSLEETVRALADHVEAQAGVTLAHTALIASVISTFKAKGLIAQDDVNAIYDHALTGAENATEITAEVSRRARMILELMAGGMAGQRP